MNILSKIYNRLCLLRKQCDEHKKYRREINEIKKCIGGQVAFFLESTNIGDNSVVVIEPNPFHGETVLMKWLLNSHLVEWITISVCLWVNIQIFSDGLLMIT